MKTFKETYGSIRPARIILAALLLATAFFDFFTFIRHSGMWAFEINPLFIWFKSVALIVIGKFVSVGIVSYIIINPKWKFDWLRFAFVLSAIYMIGFQILGGVSNLQVAAANPPPGTAYSPQEATNLYFTLILGWYIAPMIIAVLAFKTYKWCGYE